MQMRKYGKCFVGGLLLAIFCVYLLCVMRCNRQSKFGIVPGTIITFHKCFYVRGNTSSMVVLVLRKKETEMKEKQIALIIDGDNELQLQSISCQHCRTWLGGTLISTICINIKIKLNTERACERRIE